MTTLKVENNSHRGKAFRVHGGLRVVKARAKATIENAVELTEDQIEAFARDGVKVKQSDGSKPEKTDGEIKAIHHGGGKFNVVVGKTVLLSGLSKEDADAINEMSQEDRAAYVEASKKD